MDTAQRAALAAVRELREPRPPEDPIAAIRTVERLAESLTGFAVGAAILPMAQRLSRAGGTEVKTAVRQVLAALAGPDGPAVLPVPPPAPQGPRFLADADQRPLVDELGARLCARLPLARSDARVLLRQLVAAAERATPEFSKALADAVHVALADVSPIAERVGPAVHQAWQHAIAVMHDRPILTGAWTTWSRRAAGLADPTPELTATDVVAAGYVMRIG